MSFQIEAYKYIYTPILKVNNPHSSTEQSPITFLPVPGKIVEQLIYNRLSLFLENNDVLNLAYKIDSCKAF